MRNNTDGTSQKRNCDRSHQDTRDRNVSYIGPERVVLSVVEPTIRGCVDAAARGNYAVVHADSVDDACSAMPGRSVQALLVSPSALQRDEPLLLATLVVRHPEIRAVAVISARTVPHPRRLLDVGACGIRELLDLSVPEGCAQLRRFLADARPDTAGRILEAVVPALGSPTSETRRFFEAIVRAAPQTRTIREFARAYGVLPSTMMSRFLRARLPSPKRYLGWMRLVYASAMLEGSGRSIADVADELHYSSPQSLGRTVKTTLGVTAGEMRSKYGFDIVLTHYTANFIEPYRAVFERFTPTGIDARERHG